jgi:hypothetical protein
MGTYPLMPARRLLQSEKRARGTLRPCREAGIVEIAAPDRLPLMPAWLTAEGEVEWADLLPRVAALASEVDSALLGQLANLQGAMATCWRGGEVPPAAYLSEHRRLSELFGIAGARSRLVVGAGKGSEANPFLANGKKRGRA